jgi:ABC-2 type transport system permease protein
MTRATVIARRELGSYFYSPIAYVAMVVFLLLCGLMFRNDFKPGQVATMRTMFDNMVLVLVFVIPVLCMGLLAQEWASGTIETMMTAPISETDIVIGKFLGSLGFLAILLIPTLLYVLMLWIYGHPEMGPILSGYIGIILVGAMFISTALFCSSLTRSQVVAAVMAAAILSLITIVPWLAGGSTELPEFWRKVADQAVYRRYSDFSRGVLDSANVVFFVVATAAFLFFTVKVLESRRWK